MFFAPLFSLFCPHMRAFLFYFCFFKKLVWGNFCQYNQLKIKISLSSNVRTKVSDSFPSLILMAQSFGSFKFLSKLSSHQSSQIQCKGIIAQYTEFGNALMMFPLTRCPSPASRGLWRGCGWCCRSLFPPRNGLQRCIFFPRSHIHSWRWARSRAPHTFAHGFSRGSFSSVFIVRSMVFSCSFLLSRHCTRFRFIRTFPRGSAAVALSIPVL